jgi:hypothetical protein
MIQLLGVSSKTFHYVKKPLDVIVTESDESIDFNSARSPENAVVVESVINSYPLKKISGEPAMYTVYSQNSKENLPCDC